MNFCPQLCILRYPDIISEYKFKNAWYCKLFFLFIFKVNFDVFRDEFFPSSISIYNEINICSENNLQS